MDLENKNEEITKPKELFQAIFGPPIGNKEEIRRLIIEKGFPNVVSILIRKKHCFARFRTQSEVDNFVKEFHDLRIGDQQLFANRSNKKVYEYPPCTRIFITGFEPGEIFERDIYFHFSPYGYIKHISLKNNHAYIDFDSIEDAKEVMNNLSDLPLVNKSIELSFAQTAPNTDFSNLILPLSEVIDENNPIWNHLVNIIQGRANVME